MLLAVTCRPDEAGAESSLARIATDGLARRLTPRPLSRAAAAALLAGELGEQPGAARSRRPATRSAAAIRSCCTSWRAPSPCRRSARAPSRRRGCTSWRPSASRAPCSFASRASRPRRGPSRARSSCSATTSTCGSSPQLAGLDDGPALAGADELRGAAILDPTAASLRFVHPLVRTALHPRCRPASARRRTRAPQSCCAPAARAPSNLPPTSSRPTPCGDRATVETLIEAGAKALASGAPRSAIAYLTRALHEPAPADLRVEVLDPLLTACIRATDQPAYAEIEEDILAELQRDPTLLGRWGVELSSWLAISGRMQQAVELLEQAIEGPRGEDDVDRAFSLEAQLSRLAQLPPHVARDRLQRYRDRIEPDSRAGRLAAAIEARWAVVHGTAAEAAALSQRALGDDGRILIEQSRGGRTRRHGDGAGARRATWGRDARRTTGADVRASARRPARARGSLVAERLCRAAARRPDDRRGRRASVRRHRAPRRAGDGRAGADAGARRRSW